MALLPLICAARGEYGVPIVSGYSASAWPGTDLILYLPLRMPEAFTVKRVYWANASSVSGNTNVGLYSAAGSKLWEIGSTAQTPTNQTQFTDVSPDQSHAAGLYYFAMQHSNTSGQFCRSAPGVNLLAPYGLMQEAAGSFALPATATFAALANNYLPLAGLDLRG